MCTSLQEIFVLPKVVCNPRRSHGEDFCFLKNERVRSMYTAQCRYLPRDYLQHGATTCVTTCGLYCQLGVAKAFRVRQHVAFVLLLKCFI
ncbi:hypothetical protein DPMN_120353 [Dreissena polymorpha]|uniref:Uncharacterized protein n=1 Tax=Dreissena polymorpha TaxID=45954 RepID=A0A9D4JNG4_DREPO|nr:hypothetical protein DPMN_120353 [Dreissena polymorpha]